MDIIFEVIDKSGRRIRLTKKSWSHVRRDHPNVQEHEIEETIVNPMKITETEKSDKWYYYNYITNKKSSSKYLRLIVRYLNGTGFVITAHFVPRII